MRDGLCRHTCALFLSANLFFVLIPSLDSDLADMADVAFMMWVVGVGGDGLACSSPSLASVHRLSSMVSESMALIAAVRAVSVNFDSCFFFFF